MYSLLGGEAGVFFFWGGGGGGGGGKHPVDSTLPYYY